jgi:hypothetical protein
MHIQFSTTEIGSSPLAFGWKFDSVPQEDPATDPPDNQGGGTPTPTTETKPDPEEDEAVPEAES